MKDTSARLQPRAKRETIKATDRILVLITASSEEEAHQIAKSLVDEKKAACVNIVPMLDSLFRWKGKLDSARESLLLVKTRASLFSQIITLVKEMHSYEVPEIIALPIIGGTEEYLKWLDSACRQTLVRAGDNVGGDKTALTGTKSRARNPRQIQKPKARRM